MDCLEKLFCRVSVVFIIPLIDLKVRYESGILPKFSGYEDYRYNFI